MSLPDVPTDPRSFARWFVAVPLRRRTWANLAYLSLAFPLGLAYFVVLVTGFVTSGVLVVFLVGLVLLLGMVYLTRELAAFERWLADTLLSVPVPAATETPPNDPVGHVKHVLTDLRTWTGIAYLFGKFAVGIGAFVALVVMGSFSAAFVFVPLNYRNVRVGLFPPGGDVALNPSVAFELQTWEVGLTVPFRLTTWYVDSLPEALVVSALGVVLALLSFHASNALAWLLGQVTRAFLGGADRSAFRRLLEA